MSPACHHSGGAATEKTPGFITGKLGGSVDFHCGPTFTIHSLGDLGRASDSQLLSTEGVLVGVHASLLFVCLFV